MFSAIIKSWNTEYKLNWEHMSDISKTESVTNIIRIRTQVFPDIIFSFTNISNLFHPGFCEVNLIFLQLCAVIMILYSHKNVVFISAIYINRVYLHCSTSWEAKKKRAKDVSAAQRLQGQSQHTANSIILSRSLANCVGMCLY